MILVRKIDGAWQRWSEPGPVTQYVSIATLHYRDGRVAEIDTDPYPVEVMLDPGKVAQLLAEGVWTEADIEPYGARIAEPFTVPAGKVTTGAPRYVEKAGKVVEVYKVADAPPPPPEPTKAEKLAALLGERGLTLDDLKEALAK